MPGTTVPRGYPYPLDADPIDVAGDIQRLAEAIDDNVELTQQFRAFTTPAQRASQWPNAPIGAMSSTIGAGNQPVIWVNQGGIGWTPRGAIFGSWVQTNQLLNDGWTNVQFGTAAFMNRLNGAWDGSHFTVPATGVARIWLNLVVRMSDAGGSGNLVVGQFDVMGQVANITTPWSARISEDFKQGAIFSVSGSALDNVTVGDQLMAQVWIGGAQGIRKESTVSAGSQFVLEYV